MKTLRDPSVQSEIRLRLAEPVPTGSGAVGIDVCPPDDLPSAGRLLGWFGREESRHGGDPGASTDHEMAGTAGAAAVAAGI